MPNFSQKKFPYYRFSRLTTLAVPPFIFSQVAFAAIPAGMSADNAATANLPTTVLPVIAVTATRSPTLQNNLIAQTQVIDEQTLKHHQGESALDVLKSQMGINIYESGGRGTLSNFWLRGMNNRQVLVLVDGIRFASTSSGMPALSLIPVSQIERIEVLYGASGASQYGADALGGVIQVFTKGNSPTGIAQSSSAKVTVGAGTQRNFLDTSLANVSGNYIKNGTQVSISAGHEQSDGINATLPTAFDYYPDKDGFKSNSVSLSASHQLNTAVKVGMSGIFTKTKTAYDSNSFDPITYASSPYKNTYSKQKNTVANAYIDYNKDQLASTLKYGESIDDSTAFDGATPKGGKYKSRQQQAIWQAGYRLPLGQLIGGAEWLKQSLNSNVYTAKDRDTTSEFLGYQYAGDTLDAQANVRYDDNSQYGNKTTYNVGGAYRITPTTRIGASYATGFRVPTFNDLYDTRYFSNNPNLKPETSKNSEVFVENSTVGKDFSQNTRITGYRTDVKDLIGFDSKTFVTENIDKARINGVTLSSDWEKGAILFGANYDYQQAENKTKGVDDKKLSYHPEHKGGLYVGYRHADYDIRAEAQYVGKRFTDKANKDSLSDYTLLNLSGNYYLSPKLTLGAKLNNLTNKSYQTIKDYNSLGINSMVTLSYDWY